VLNAIEIKAREIKEHMPKGKIKKTNCNEGKDTLTLRP